MNKKNNTVVIIALVLYLLLLAWAILFKFLPPRELIFDLNGYRSPINLVPFGAMLGNPREAVKELVFNLIAFVPLGMLLSALGWPRRAWGAVAAGFLISLFFEAFQYAFRIGAADITDIILNTAGTALGVGLYAVLRAILKEKAPRVTGVVLLVCEALFISAAVLLLAVSDVTY